MDRLYIISSSVESGSAFGCKLGLSSPQFKVLTSMKDLEGLPYKIIFVHDNNHPADSVQMNDELISKRNISLKDGQYLNEVIMGIYSDLSMINGMYDPLRSPDATASGKDKLALKLTSRGMTDINGFEFIINRDAKGFFSIIPRSPLMTVIVNLLIAQIHLINQGSKIQKFIPGKPLLVL